MSEQTNHSNANERYEIRLQGRLHARWSAWFDGLTVSHERDGTTLLRGDVVDQAALHGLLRKLADLGLPLLSVTQLGPDQPDAPTTDPNWPHHPRRTTCPTPPETRNREHRWTAIARPR